MMGDKLRLLFWDMPEDKKEWSIVVKPTGEVNVKCFDPETKLRGVFSFEENNEVHFIKQVLVSLGFKERETRNG